VAYIYHFDPSLSYVPMWVLRLHSRFRASTKSVTKSEPMVKPQKLCLTVRAQWTLERLGGCGVRPSIWQHPHGKRREKLGGSESCRLAQSNRQYLWRNSKGLLMWKWGPVVLVGPDWTEWRRRRQRSERWWAVRRSLSKQSCGWCKHLAPLDLDSEQRRLKESGSPTE